MNNANDRLDYLIGLAMFDLAKEYEEEYDAIDTSGVVIDEKFDKRIYKLIGKKEREPKIRKIRKISFRVAVAAMLIMSIMLLTMLFISGIREAIWQAIVKWYDDHITVSFVQAPAAYEGIDGGTHTNGTSNSGSGVNGTQNVDNADNAGMSTAVSTSESESDQASDTVGATEGTEITTDDNTSETTPVISYPQKILEYRKPVLLEEYVEYEGLKDDSMYIIDYCTLDGNGEPQWIFNFQQNVKTQDEEQFDSTGKEIKNANIKGAQAIILLAIDGEPNTITWNDGQYLYTINGFLSENELIEIAETVE